PCWASRRWRATCRPAPPPGWTPTWRCGRSRPPPFLAPRMWAIFPPRTPAGARGPGRGADPRNTREETRLDQATDAGGDGPFRPAGARPGCGRAGEDLHHRGAPALHLQLRQRGGPVLGAHPAALQHLALREQLLLPRRLRPAGSRRLLLESPG